MNPPAQDRARISNDGADALAGAADIAQRASALAGFDAFVDRIADVVDTRSAPGDAGYRRIDGIDAFGRRIAQAAGRSGNFELVVKREKTGGNAALHAGALAALGARVAFLGSVGATDDSPEPHEVFRDFARACAECVALAEPGQTDALEFDDGKIMLGRPGPLDRIDWARLIERAGGVAGLRTRCAAARTLVFGNWTMHRAMDDIWRRLASEVLPGLDASRGARTAFVDLADPARRSDGEIVGAMDALAALHERAPVTLGVNLAEARRVGAAVGCALDLPGEGMPAGSRLERGARALREALGFACVVIHCQRRSAAADRDGGAWFDAPYAKRPALSTGAGDHFNAGFVLAGALDLPLAQRLACASACAGHYVRRASAPTREELIAMLRAMPAPEGA